MVKIASGAARHLRIAIDRPVRTAFGTMTERHAILLILEDAEGHHGVGETWVNFPLWAPWERLAAYERVIIPWLEGREVQDVAETVAELYRALLGPAQQSGTIGPLLSAICAVELALWDLASQSANLPLARLLFRTPRDRVRVYASGINSPLPWDLIDEHLERGVTLFKLKLGFGDETDRRNLQELHSHLAGRAELAVDVNRAWSLPQAIRWLDTLVRYDVQWVEEPLCVADEPRLDVLRALDALPIAGLENALLPPDADVDAAANGPETVLQPDITKYAPLHMALKLREAAEAAGKRFIPHFLGSAPGQAASLHLAAGCAEGLVELDINRNPLRTELFSEPFDIREGAIALPDRPGLGWQLAEG